MKKTILLLLACMLILSFVGCAAKNQSFDIGEVTKITGFCGSTGKSIEITDADDIKHITDNINSLSFSREESSKNNEGFNYYLTWYDSNGEQVEKLIVMTEGRISYDDYFYDVSDTDRKIDIEFLDKLFEQ